MGGEGFVFTLAGTAVNDPSRGHVQPVHGGGVRHHPLHDLQHRPTATGPAGHWPRQWQLRPEQLPKPPGQHGHQWPSAEQRSRAELGKRTPRFT